MKLLIALTAVLIGLSVVASVPPLGAAEPTTAPATQPVIFNKVCPVTKEAVDPKVPTFEYKGKTIGFCCADCIKDFKANPEKYMANLK
jgi:YHS domain-containing protein